MVQTLPEALAILRATVKTEVADAALADGGGRPAGQGPLASLQLEELKRLLPGSLLVLTSGELAFVPINRAVVKRTGEDLPRITVCEKVAGAGTERDSAWLEANVLQVLAGVLTLPSGGAGPQAGQVALSGGVSVTINLIDASPMVAVSVVLGNMAKTMDYKTLSVKLTIVQNHPISLKFTTNNNHNN